MLTTESALRKDRRNATSEMQHRHFATIASILSQTCLNKSAKLCIIEEFADALRYTNPKFDRACFLKMCGL